LQQAFSEDVANLQTFCKEQAEFVGPLTHRHGRY